MTYGDVIPSEMVLLVWETLIRNRMVQLDQQSVDMVQLD